MTHRAACVLYLVSGMILVVVIAMAHVAEARRVQAPVHGFSVNCPKGWNATVYPEGDQECGGVIELQNFRGVRQQMFLLRGDAYIHISVWPPWKDEYADFIERYAGPSTKLTSSQNPARVEGTRTEAMGSTMRSPHRIVVYSEHFVEVAAFKGGRLFEFSLVYIEDDPKGEQYKQILTDVMNSLQVNQSAASCPIEPTVTIAVGSAQGAPGDRITLPVTLRTSRNDVESVQGELLFDPQLVSLEHGPLEWQCKRGDDLPPCVSAWFDSTLRRCLRPSPEPDCPPAVMVYSRESVACPNKTIPDGTVLYTCTLDLSPTAATGHYPVVISHLRADGPHGRDLYAAGTDGDLVVVPRSMP